ncbi:MAG: hypothetical protein RLZZ387_3402 [Chloroflexota bacterium]|jgi:DNA-binding NarL/FixJ family response regulator
MHSAAGPHEPIRLVIADDQELSRGGLRSFFMHDSAFVVQGEAENGDEALRLCKELQPHILLLDIRMGQSDGLHVAGQIREICPDVHIVMVTMHEDVQYLIESMRVGAKGFLLKDTRRSEFLSTVRKVMQGETAFNAQLMTRAIYGLTKASSPRAMNVGESLTTREKEVLTRIAYGQTNRQIAAALNISPATVKVHVEHLIAKLGVTGRTQAAVRAIELGMVTSPNSTPEQ